MPNALPWRYLDEWDCSDKYKSDPNAFIFSLTNKDNSPLKMKVDPNEHQWAILCHSELDNLKL